MSDEHLPAKVFLNKGLDPAVDCIRCPRCWHEQPVESLAAHSTSTERLESVCRCGMKLYADSDSLALRRERQRLVNVLATEAAR